MTVTELSETAPDTAAEDGPSGPYLSITVNTGDGRYRNHAEQLLLNADDEEIAEALIGAMRAMAARFGVDEVVDRIVAKTTLERTAFRRMQPVVTVTDADKTEDGHVADEPGATS